MWRSGASARNVGGTGAERGHAVPRRRSRAPAHGVPLRELLGPRRHVLAARWRGAAAQQFAATLITIDDRRLASGRDFDPDTGALGANADVVLLDEGGAARLATVWLIVPSTSRSVESRVHNERPKAPFITSTLQQEAARKLGFSARVCACMSRRASTNAGSSPTCAPTPPRSPIRRYAPRGRRSAACTVTTTCPTSRCIATRSRTCRRPTRRSVPRRPHAHGR